MSIVDGGDLVAHDQVDVAFDLDGTLRPLDTRISIDNVHHLVFNPDSLLLHLLSLQLNELGHAAVAVDAQVRHLVEGQGLNHLQGIVHGQLLIELEGEKQKRKVDHSEGAEEPEDFEGDVDHDRHLSPLARAALLFLSLAILVDAFRVVLEI